MIVSIQVGASAISRHRFVVEVSSYSADYTPAD